MKAEALRINTDSQLLHRQLSGVYKVKNSNISNLYRQVAHLLENFKKVSVTNISRENNRGADKLATMAIKEKLQQDRSLIKG
jgi:ribonuclease HI